MGHRVFVRDLVIVTRQHELPDRCPRCKASFEVGSTNVGAWYLRPRLERLQLTRVLDGETLVPAFETKDVLRNVTEEPWERLPAVFRCMNCHRVLHRMHHRTYNLSEMSRILTFKLRRLLYDGDTNDETVKEKCFTESTGYSGDCLACNIEAEIGTKEVPHPIDPRIHTCERHKDELDQS